MAISVKIPSRIYRVFFPLSSFHLPSNIHGEFDKWRTGGGIAQQTFHSDLCTNFTPVDHYTIYAARWLPSHVLHIIYYYNIKCAVYITFKMCVVLHYYCSVSIIVLCCIIILVSKLLLIKHSTCQTRGMMMCGGWLGGEWKKKKKQ